MALVAAVIACPVEAFAKPEDGTIASDTGWHITSGGTLVIDGTVPSFATSPPWLPYREEIHGVTAQPGAKVNSCFALCNGCSKLESVDLANLDVSEVSEAYGMFAGCSTLRSVDLSFMQNTRPLVSAGSMFSGCSSLTSLNVTPLNTSSVTDMSNTFRGCASLTSLDLSNFNTSSATSMDYMFRDCTSLESLTLSDMDTSNVINMNQMFWGCESLRSLDLSTLDTKSVKEMEGMFRGCSSLESLDLSAFDTSQVTKMYDMFMNCTALSSVNLSSFNTENVTSMGEMFYGCSSLESVDLSTFDTSKVDTQHSWPDSGGLFFGCDSLQIVRIGEGYKAFDWNENSDRSLPAATASNGKWWSQESQQWLTVDEIRATRSGIADTYASFEIPPGLNAEEYIGAIASGTWGTCPWVINKDGVLIVGAGTGADCERHHYEESLDVTDSPWRDYGSQIKEIEFHSVIAPANCEGLFYAHRSSFVNLTKITFDGFDTSNVTNMKRMFAYCTSLAELDLTCFNTSKVTDMTGMFDCCTKLKHVNISSFDMSKVDSAYEMFVSCGSLEEIDCSVFNDANISNMSHMFVHCEKLEDIDVSGWNFSNYLHYCESTSQATYPVFWNLANLKVFKVGSETIVNDYTFPDYHPQGNGAAQHEKWWSQKAQQWFTRDEIIASRSGIADTYTNEESTPADDNVNTGYIPSRDGWRFKNLSNEDWSGGRPISDSILNRVFDDDSRWKASAIVGRYLKNNPGGMCYGLSLSSLLFFQEDPQLSSLAWVGWAGNSDGPASAGLSALHDFLLADRFGYSVPSYNMKVSEFVQAMHMVQWLPEVSADADSHKGIEAAISKMRSTDRPVLMHFSDHTVLAYAIDYDESSDSDQIRIYDSNAIFEGAASDMRAINSPRGSGARAWNYESWYGSSVWFKSSISYNDYEVLEEACRHIRSGGNSLSGYGFLFLSNGSSTLSLGGSSRAIPVLDNEEDNPGNGESSEERKYWIAGGEKEVGVNDCGAASNVAYVSDVASINLSSTATTDYSISESDGELSVNVSPSGSADVTVEYGHNGLVPSVVIGGTVAGSASVQSEGETLRIEGFSGDVTATFREGDKTVVKTLAADDDETYTADLSTSSLFPINISGATVTGVDGWTYDATEHAVTPVVKLGDDTLVPGTDYIVSGDTSATNAGTYSVTITGDGSYTGTKTVGYTVSPKEVEATVTVEPAAFTYDGDDHFPEGCTVKDGETTIPASEYVLPTLVVGASKNVGTYDYVLTDAEGGNYVVSGSATYEITPKPIALGVSLEGWTYGQEPKAPQVTGNDGGAAVAYGYKARDAADEEYSADAPTGAGLYTVRASVEASGNYGAGSATCDFEIARAASAVTQPPEAVAGLSYTGGDLALVSAGSAAGGTLQYSTDGESWGAAPPTGRDVKSYQVWYRVAGDANHEDAAAAGPVSVEIAKSEDPAAVVPSATVTRGGNAVELSALVTGAEGDVTYAIDGEARGCSVGEETGTFTSGVEPATVTVRVTVAESANRTGKTATIAVAVSEKATAKLGVSQRGVTYGEELPAPAYEALAGSTTKLSYSGTTRAGTAYGPAAEPPADAGSYAVTVTCETSDTVHAGTALFAIAPAPIEDAAVTLGDALTYNGKAQAQAVASVLVGDVDVTSLCDVSGNVATDAGDYELTVSARSTSNFTGSVTCPFTVARAAYSVGTVTAGDVRDSLDPADVVLTRTDTSLAGRLAITEAELAYGTNTYHWAFTPADANHEPSSGTVEVTVTGHEWGSPAYEWAEGDASCTARRACANNASHVERETVVPSRKVTAEPTTDAEGKATLTAEFKNAAFERQSKEVTLPRLPKPGKVGSGVTMEGDGPAVEMSVPDGLLESMLTERERELVAGGADATLVATVRWLGAGDVPVGDLALLAKACEDGKTSMGWEAYLDVRLSVRVGDAERRVTKTEKPIAFKVKLDPEGKDAVSRGLAQAIADGKADGSVTVRRVHEGAVDEVGSAKRGETVTFESDRFSTYAVGSAASAAGTTEEGGNQAQAGKDAGSQDSQPGQDSGRQGVRPDNDAGEQESQSGRTTSSGGSVGSATPSSVATRSAASGSDATSLAGTSDDARPVVPIAIAGLAALALAALNRRARRR